MRSLKLPESHNDAVSRGLIISLNCAVHFCHWKGSHCKQKDKLRSSSISGILGSITKAKL